MYDLRLQLSLDCELLTTKFLLILEMSEETKTTLPTILLMLERVLVHINPASCISYWLTLHEVQWTHWGRGMQEVVLGRGGCSLVLFPRPYLL